MVFILTDISPVILVLWACANTCVKLLISSEQLKWIMKVVGLLDSTKKWRSHVAVGVCMMPWTIMSCVYRCKFVVLHPKLATSHIQLSEKFFNEVYNRTIKIPCWVDSVEMLGT